MPAIHAFTDTAYGPHLRQRYDLFIPTDADQTPTVICLPGGWWTSGDHHDLRGVALRLAEAGWSAASIGTRLLEKDLKSGKELIADVIAATEKIIDDAVTYGAHDRGVILLGSGSGSLTAMIVATRMLNDRKCRLRVGAVIACGLTPSSIPWEGCPIERAPIVKTFGGENPSELDIATFPADAFPPMLVLHGEQDDTVPTRHALALQKRVADAGEIARLETVSGAGHRWIESVHDRPARFAIDRIISFLREVAPAGTTQPVATSASTSGRLGSRR
jgi:acetyl esterase/lipase